MTGGRKPEGAQLRSTPKRGRVIAITGACSFLGRNLVGLLEEDRTVDRIVVLDIERPRAAGPKTAAYKLDLTQPTASARMSEVLRAERPHAVVHLAFLSTPTTAEAWAHELESVGTMHVLNACREVPIARLVTLSSTLLYGPHPENPNFLTEEHPLRGLRECAFVQDKIEAEEQVRRFAAERPETAVTVLRLATVLGPTARSWATRWLSHRFVPTLLGYDPLIQLLHEADALSSLKLALDVGAPGVFNVTGHGVLPLSTVVTLAGRMALPLPPFVLSRVTAALWLAGLADAPPPFVGLLRHLCVADGTKAKSALGFEPAYSTRDAVLDFGGALRLREARMMSDELHPSLPLDEAEQGMGAMRGPS